MFLLFVIALCALEFASSHFLDVDYVDVSVMIAQWELVLVLGAIVFSSGSMRERSVLDIVLIWAIWILATDWVPYFPPIIATLETFVFAALLAWIWFRPYHHISNPVGYGTVFIAFYGGPKAPFLSRMASHFGFPFSSVAIVANELAIRPSKATGTMIETPPHILEAKGYIFIDTKIPVTQEIMDALENEVLGTATRYGIFRVKCLKNLMPALKCLGPEWVPKHWPAYPARYFRQCVENVA